MFSSRLLATGVSACAALNNSIRKMPAMSDFTERVDSSGCSIMDLEVSALKYSVYL
jgi:hypothetical protein